MWSSLHFQSFCQSYLTWNGEAFFTSALENSLCKKNPYRCAHKCNNRAHLHGAYQCPLFRTCCLDPTLRWFYAGSRLTWENQSSFAAESIHLQTLDASWIIHLCCQVHAYLDTEAINNQKPILLLHNPSDSHFIQLPQNSQNRSTSHNAQTFGKMNWHTVPNFITRTTANAVELQTWQQKTKLREFVTCLGGLPTLTCKQFLHRCSSQQIKSINYWNSPIFSNA